MPHLGTVIFVDSVHSILWNRLQYMGWECIDQTTLAAEAAKKEIVKYDGIVIRSKFKLTEALLKSCKQLKFIARAGSGLENIDLNAANRLDIKVFSSPEGNRDALAEHATGAILMLMNNLKRADEEVRSGVWKRAENRGYELKGKTIGLIGYGVMGKSFAERLSGFGIEIIAYDINKTNFSDKYTTEVTLKELQQRSDIVSLHMDFHLHNKYFVDEIFIDEFKKPFYLINTARGFNVNSEALVTALKSGKILGACLDVLEYESVSFEGVSDTNNPPALQYLLTADNVILSPHIAGWTHESHFKLSNVLADKIQNYYKNH
jgi:D-3-phosphoglycerate dehydrogenase